MSNQLTAVFMLLAISLSVLGGCKEKSYEKKSNDNVYIVRSLNESNFETVIANLEDKGKLTTKETFYLASAYAIKGGADIYSLYPIMEVLLFHRKAIDWDSLKNQKNPYVRFLRESKRIESSSEEKYAAWVKFKQDYLKFSNMSEDEIRKPDCKNIVKSSDSLLTQYCNTYLARHEHMTDQFFKNLHFNNSDNDLTWSIQEAYYESVEPIYDFSSKEVNVVELLIQLEKDLEDNLKLKVDFLSFKDFPKSTYESQSERVARAYEIMNELEIIHETIGRYGEKTYELNQKKATFFSGGIPSGTKDSVKALNFIWSLYESIPLIQRLPKISLEQQDDITRALELLGKITDDGKYRMKSFQMMTLLMGFSFTSILADSTKLERVSQPMDFPCHMDQEKLVQYHPILHDRALFLAEIAEDSGKLQDDEEKLLKQMKSQSSNFSRIMSESAKAELFERVTGNKALNCGPTSYL